MRESAFFQQVADEVEVETVRKDVLKLLRGRFGETAAAEFQQAVNSVKTLEQLDALLMLAARCRSVSRFRQSLPKS
jgi:hypothetical protein